MLDRRAWLISGVIILIAAGAYLLWLYRPKATYSARSLSAAQHHAEDAAKNKAQSLHIEGCREDFIVSPGELIEPRVVPGSSLNRFTSVYGSEPNRPDSSTYLWDQEAFTLTAINPNEKAAPESLRISVKGHHIVETLDGVELGLDSFSRIFGKMQDKKVEIHERILKDDKNWTLIVTIDSACSPKFRSEYTRTLPRNPETDREITQLPPAPGLDPGVPRSDIFMNKVVYDYAMVPSNGQDDSAAGNLSEHD
ncbi:MAG TPA: hypothetical protein VHZ52_09130 [Acidobacteriaceae bacterium]|jgi:hypothetical protein|nr:hypothetical protein [Acidobacteriaceae bacterium]